MMMHSADCVYHLNIPFVHLAQPGMNETLCEASPVVKVGETTTSDAADCFVCRWAFDHPLPPIYPGHRLITRAKRMVRRSLLPPDSLNPGD